MYLSHFGLRQRPFRPVPDAAGYYPAAAHEAALARLAQAVADDEGLMLLTGEPGTGKTLTAHELLARLGDSVAPVWVCNGRLASRTELFQALLFDLALPHRGLSDHEMRLALADRFLDNFAAGRRTLVVIDEAHHLAPDLFEEVRLLGNLEAAGGKAVQTLLVALPVIAEALRRPDLEPVRQRLAVCARLEPLGQEEAADYLVHQVRASGGRPELVFGDEALEVLTGAGRGVPRLLNQAAHAALALAASAGSPLVDAEAALEAVNLGAWDDPAADAAVPFAAVGRGDVGENESA